MASLPGRAYPHILILLCLVVLLPRHFAAAQAADEQQLLLRIKRSWGDPPELASWNSAAGAAVTSHCTSWAHVSCDGAGRVASLSLQNITISGNVIPDAIGELTSLTTLDLRNTSVSGFFPAFLYNCTSIEHLDLSRNKLTGELPADIGRLGKKTLTYLALDNNGFTGAIPGAALSVLTNLTTLTLNSNAFTGAIPPELGELTSLRTLKLELNQFSSGKLPESFKNLRKLTTVCLANCNLTGEFPSFFAGMPDMAYLDLSMNGITGNIPPSIWNLKRLQYLYAYTNKLTGNITINGAIGATGLIELDVSENQLTGVIPESFGTLRQLRLLKLMTNNLSGEIPASIAQLPSLVFLWLYSNKLTGTLPSELGMHSPALRDIQVDDNELTGPIPAGICQNRGLWLLTASDNHLNGSIPAGLANCSTLISLQLQDNKLSGEVPPALWTETKLMTLLLQNNGGLSGALPSTLFWNLTRLYIWNNRFGGALPESADRLQKLNAADNVFSGDMPRGLPSGMPLLQELVLSGNRLSGAIPESVATLGGLTQMNLSRNELTGEIPAALGAMPVLTLLDLSSNQLSGAIPPALGTMKANQLNLSSNRLFGEIPQALAISAYEGSFLGNPALCTPDAAASLAGVSPCRAAKASGRVSPGLRAGLLGAGAGLLALIAALAFFLVRDARRRERLGTERREEAEAAAWKLVPFQALGFGEKAVLRGLAEENLVGKGGSGSVYRVECNGSNTTVVAVKRIWTGGKKVEKGLEKEFESEVGILGHVRHANIVKLLCCLSRAETKLLVYEYMDNGSLDRWLHGSDRALGWPARVRVAVGAARGLCYMHHECSPAVVHRDVKCSNILLDAELDAKVADFGLARMLAQAGTPDTMTAVAGTFGYMAPECAYTTKANEKVDVYSFGVVLLELATGREASDGGEHGSLAEWAWRHLQSGKPVAEAADKRIGEAAHGDDVEVVFKLGIICTGAQPSTRPTMKDVLQILTRCEQAAAHQKTTADGKATEYDARCCRCEVAAAGKRRPMTVLTATSDDVPKCAAATSR